MRNKIGAAFESELFGQDAQSAVGCDEVHRLNALIALDGEQEVPQKDGAAGAGGCDGQILRRMVRQVLPRTEEHREVAQWKSRQEPKD